MNKASEAVTASGGGIGFTNLLTIVFITLKLCHVIDWSWWWVLAPLWIGASIAVVILLTILVIAIFVSWGEK